MCGIAGVFGARAAEVVDKMLRVLAHRGPDDQHCVAGAGFTLGARRLSIIDLEGGRQPLATPDPAVWACQNGEIYNFPELRHAFNEIDDYSHVLAIPDPARLLAGCEVGGWRVRLWRPSLVEQNLCRRG